MKRSYRRYLALVYIILISILIADMASGNQAGTQGFMRVVETPLRYVAGGLNTQEVSRPTGSK